MPYFRKPLRSRAGGKTDRQKAMARADKYFSEYIRLRDTPGRCPTCGKWLFFEMADCGHYISRSKLNVRFDERNAAAQCRHDNRFRQGMALEYRFWMVEKYGEKEVKELEQLALLKGGGFTIDDLNMIADKYREKCKELAWKKAPRAQ